MINRSYKNIVVIIINSGINFSFSLIIHFFFPKINFSSPNKGTSNN